MINGQLVIAGKAQVPLNDALGMTLFYLGVPVRYANKPACTVAEPCH